VRGVVAVVGIVAAAGLVAVAVASSGLIVFSDDFSDPHSGWYVANDRLSATSYKEGKYWIRIKKPGSDAEVGNDLKKIVRSADMQVDAREYKGGRGDDLSVVCYTNIDSDVGYYFQIEPSRGGYDILRSKGRSNKLLIQGFDPRAIHRVGARNHLSARCIGAATGQPARLTLSVNQRFVAQARDPNGLRSFEGIGLHVHSRRGGSVASFDNALVRER
jgi:hypothetical protein